MRPDLRYLFASVAATAAFTFLALAFPNMSRVATIPAAIACAVLTVYFVWPEIRDFHKNRQKRVIALIGMIVCSIGFAGFAAFYFWPSELKDTPKAEIVAVQPSAPLLFEWKWSRLPTIIPVSGTVWTMPNTAQIEFGGQPLFLSPRVGSPGDKLTWLEDQRQYGGVHRCDITNYADYPIFNLAMTFKTEFFKPEKDGSHHPGPAAESYDRPVTISKIDPKETFSFYTYSDSRMYVSISLPKEVTYLRDDKSQRETARLMPQAEQEIMMFPMTFIDPAPKSPPVSPPPAPSPPGKRGKK
jgi:hypothetical protein